MLIIASIGLIFVFSTTYKPEQPVSLFFKKQVIGVLTGLSIYFICCTVDYRHLERWGHVGYLGVLGLLVFTKLKGTMGMGAQRWIYVAGLKMQPSELAKLLLPPFTAHYFAIRHDQLTGRLGDFVPVLVVLGVSCMLILKQPDLGTALILLGSGLTMLWLLGLPRRFFLYGALVVALSAPLLWHTLKPYQQKRILVFLGYGSAHKERYQIEQSKIAIGSGGLWGKGLLNSTQNKFMFLPESRTDFIFAVIAEEWGFVGSLFVLALYLFLFLRILFLIYLMQNQYLQLLACGLIVHILLATVINISMVIGLLPIVGNPLPLMSYGLSNVWVTFASLGMVQGISMRQ